MRGRSSASGYHDAEEPPAEFSRLVGFIGGYLIEQGTLTLQQLDEALLAQLQHASRGEAVSLADVLVRLNFATRQEIALAEQRLQRDRASRQSA